MKYIKEKLNLLSKQGNLPAFYRLEGYCKAKGYHFYMYNHCANVESLITYIKITDENNNEIASQSVNINPYHAVPTVLQYC